MAGRGFVLQVRRFHNVQYPGNHRRSPSLTGFATREPHLRLTNMGYRHTPGSLLPQCGHLPLRSESSSALKPSRSITGRSHSGQYVSLTVEEELRQIKTLCSTEIRTHAEGMAARLPLLAEVGRVDRPLKLRGPQTRDKTPH